MRAPLLMFALALAAGCGSARTAAIARAGDATFTPPGDDDTPVVHAAPTPLGNVRTLLVGHGVLDASSDRGGGLWAVTTERVYYWPPGAADPFTYDQSDGLARGWRTWKDTYYAGTPDAPATLPVSFAAVAGANAGEAVVGNVGAIADRLAVDPQSGAVLAVDNMQVTSANLAGGGGEELPEHVRRVVATRRIVADVDGTYDGTAYLGGWHGFEAFHGLDGDCGCLAFEEHRHFIPGADRNWCDSSPMSDGCWGGDVWGLALTRDGDVWAGDRHFVQLLPQRSRGPRTGLFDDGVDWAAAIDVFPGVRDEVHGLAVDADGGLWVASDGDGLAWLAPGDRAPTYFGRARLPQDHLSGVVVDGSGAVWIATARAGLARFSPVDGTWSYYTMASGLPSDTINALYVDRFDGGRTLYVATADGLALFPVP